jgi:O-antigen ligase
LLAAFLAVGGIATLFGLVDHYNVRDIFRDARWWVLYAFLGIALLTRAPRASILRGLLLGSTVFAIAAIATTVLPAYAGGLKSAALLYDRGTLRMQFDNTIFLIPAIAFVAWRAFVRRSWFDAPLLALLFVALTLSLTRTSVLVSFGMIALIGAAAIVGPDRTKTRPALLWAGILGFVVLASFAAGLALDVAGTPAVAAKPGQTVKTGQETPLDRMLFTSPESNLDTTSSSDSGRLTSFRNAIKAIEQSPIVGRGMGSLIPVPFAYNNDRASTYGKQPGVDNAYLTVGLKAGVIGVLALVALLAWAALGSIQKPSLRSWLIPAWLAIGVMTMTQSFAVSSYGPFGLALMMALTAWGYTASKGSTALSQV